MDRKTASGIMLTVLLLSILALAFHIPSVKAEGPIATIEVNPDTLNLKSNGKWITCYIELRENLEVKQIYVSTIRLNGTILVARLFELGDYDDDAVPDLMVKFSRTEVTNCILENYRMVGRLGEVTLTVTGEVGMLPYFLILTFEGSDTIRVMGK
jgi:hypothetical protein